MSAPAALRPSIAIFAAWALGWIVYMVAMVVTVYDGIISMIFQPIMGAGDGVCRQQLAGENERGTVKRGTCPIRPGVGGSLSAPGFPQYS